MGVFYPQLTANFSGNTSGTTISQFTGSLVFAGGPNITLSNSTDSLGQTVSFSGGAGGGGAFEAGASTGGNTSGTTGTVGSQIVFAGGNNITLSQSVNGASATLTMSGPNMFSAGVSTAGNTSGDTGMVSNRIVFAGSNLTLSQATAAAGATVRIIGPDPITVSQYEGPRLPLNAAGIGQSALSLQPIVVPFHITATELQLIGHMTGSSAAASGALSISAALYRKNASSAALQSSNSAVISWTSGSDTSASSFWGGQSGTRYRTMTLGSWAVTPGEYLFGLLVATATSQTAHTWTIYGATGASLGDFAGGGNASFFLPGVWTTGVFAGLPGTINMTDVAYTGNTALRQPHFRLLGTF